MTSCTMNQIFLGEVASIQNYGAFIKIPGCPQQGLIHKSQVSSSKVDDVADVLQRGERVWCKVISIDDQGKIGLSMKYVNQGSGKDLDPNGVDLQRDLQKKKQVSKHEKKVIQLQAVFNTTCTKCGTHGHLARDCFMAPDGKKYELLPEVEEDKIEIEEDKETEEKKIKHKKSKKKKSKRKKKDSDESDSNSNDSEKRKKKKKKRSKSKHKNSSHDDDSSPEREHKHQKRKHSKDEKTNAKKSKLS